MDLTTVNWTNALEEFTSQCQAADPHELAYLERAYLVRSVFCGRVWHLSHILIAPQSIVVRIHTAMLTFFWRKRSYRPIARVMLALPFWCGGMSIPDIGLMNRGVALKTMLRILGGEASPSQMLLKFWLGQYVQDLSPQSYDPSAPMAPSPRRFHAAIYAYHRKLVPVLAPVVPALASPTGMVQALLRDEVDSNDNWRERRLHATHIAWTRTVCSWLPPQLHDIMWCFAWNIHPTRNRLHAWNITSTNRCPYCDGVETNDHVLFACRTARIFWQLVRRSTNILCPVPFARRRSCHRISVLTTACGAQVLWNWRCKAVAQRRRNAPMFLLLRNLRVRVACALQQDLFSLGEEGFRRRWGDHPSIHVQGMHVAVGGVPL